MNEWKLASDHSHIPGKDYEINMNTQFNGFLSGDYEVRFLQDDRLTVCVIRNLKRLDERYTGVSVLNPKDKWDAAIGRHKAFKKALKTTYHFGQPIYAIGNWWNTDGVIETIQSLSVNQLQQDYWKRYGAEE